jgi:ketosteroid isomerase-like protein
MSEGNAQVVRKIIEGLNRSDLDAVVELCDPAIEFDWSRRLLDPVVTHGHEGVRRFFEGFSDIFEEVQIEEAKEIIELGDEVVWVGPAHFRGRISGADVRAYGAQVWTIRDGKATRFRFYQTREDALEAVRSENAPDARASLDFEA